MKLPDFSIKLDQKLDTEIFLNALANTPKIVEQQFPHIKTKQDVMDAINYVYRQTDENQKLKNVMQLLQNKTAKLSEIAMAIGKLLKHNWGNIKKITIIPVTSPIFPRYLENHTFVVPYYWPEDYIFKNCAHEMIHFLYFDKLQAVLGKKIDTEYPSEDWLISEIIAPYLVNKPELQQIVHVKDSLFTPDGCKIPEKIIRQVEQAFEECQNIVTFRKIALQKIRQS